MGELGLGVSTGTRPESDAVRATGGITGFISLESSGGTTEPGK